MRQKTRAWQRSGVLVAGAVVGLALGAAPAVAHHPVWSVTCSEVSVNLTDYADSAEVTNTVTLTVDGEELLPTKEFGTSFSDRLALPAHDRDVEVRLVVKAGDGGEFDVDQTKTAPVCPSPAPTRTPTPAPVPSNSAAAPTSAPPAEPEPTRSPSAASPEPAGQERSTPPDQDLAATGSSSATPVIAGAAALVLLAGGGIMFAVRKRRTTRD
ncbi:LAETG motif-containing sortase-dependent surface protein [Streptomyces sp. NPDC049906]|uniref:LAETG motif-containing sortase-dependent surface protein n=1 Tax=Streptomyces sp. NPDC049906 TaxID=3155656 RepID=UPI003430E7F2